jgi:hypothetical protein
MTFNETLTDWLNTFWKILISPTPGTIRAEAEKGEGKFFSAVGWLVFLAVYAFIFYIIAAKQVLLTGLVVIVLALPLSVVLFTSAIHFIHQRIFKRKQYLYEKLMYINVAILLPIQIIYTPIWTILLETSWTNISEVLSYAVLLYQIVLLVIAVKTITNLKYWQAVITVFISIIFASLVFLCTIPFILSMIGGVSSTIR